MLKKITFLIFILLCSDLLSQNKTKMVLRNIDSVNKYLSVSENITIPEKKIEYLQKAYVFAEKAGADSLITVTSSELAYQSILLEDKKSFKVYNNRILSVFKKNKDSSALGTYYHNKAHFFNNNSGLDSAYHYYNKAKKIFLKVKDKENIARVYLDLLKINLLVNDFIGTEEISIEIFENKQLKDDLPTLSITYNYLGLVHAILYDYEGSLKYYDKYLEINEKVKDKVIRVINEVSCMNNIGLLHIGFEKFEEALLYFEKALEIDPNLKENNISLYAIIIGNIGICYAETGKKEEAVQNFTKSLRIAEEIKKINIQIFILQELALIYKNNNDLNKAKLYSDKALVLSEKTSFYKDESYLLSARVRKGKEAIVFYEKFIKTKEKTEKKEQETKNKFARVRYDAQKKEEENIFLKQQNLINESIISNVVFKSKIIAFVSIVIIIFICFFYFSRKKTFEYKTNLGKAQAREQERIEIANELHDKILGDLRLIYERVVKGNIDNIADPLYQVNSEIRNLSHKLSSVDFNEVSFKCQMINLVSDYFTPAFKVRIKGLKKIDWSLIEPQIKRTLYLVIRESVQNSKKYASTSKIIIEFKKTHKIIQLNVKDFGKGFDINPLKFGLGLKNQKRRVEELNGKFIIESAMNLGTTTHVEIPLRA